MKPIKIIQFLLLLLLCSCSSLQHQNKINMKKIDISKLETLATNKQARSVGNQQVSFDASGQGGFSISEKTKDSDITTIVSKRNFKTVEVTKDIKHLKENTTESYTYSPEGLLETYIKYKNTYKFEDNEIGEIQVGNYVEVLEKYDANGFEVIHRNYNDFFKVSLQDIIQIARDNHYKKVGIFRIYLDDNFPMIPALGLTMDGISKERPYWVISFQDLTSKTGGSNLVFRIFDGISGEFVKEQKMTIFTGMDH